MPNRSYFHPSYQMNFYWKLRMDCFATTFIFDEMWGFPPKEGMSGNSFLSWPEVGIVHLAHRVTHPLSLWGHEHSRVFLSGDQATLFMSMKFHHKDHAPPWHLRDLFSFAPSRYESYNHRRLSNHRHPLRWLQLVLLIIISMQGSLLYLCTNLAAWTMINP